MSFEPCGDKSRRALLVEVVEKSQPGERLTYGLLKDLFGVDSLGAIHSAVNSAKPSVEKSTGKALVAVARVGYRVALPSEHVGLAVAHQRKGRGQLRRAQSKVENVDLGALTLDQRAAVVAARVALAA
ncbi:hypothetical protein V5S96_11055 [Corynebacterium mastitidis]|uniref:Uncharacterized protein n=1 Tax=Corynebacterium mastitidis TaxID=161890 RepID=A0ABU8P3E2_9CORY